MNDEFYSVSSLSPSLPASCAIGKSLMHEVGELSFALPPSLPHLLPRDTLSQGLRPLPDQMLQFKHDPLPLLHRGVAPGRKRGRGSSHSGIELCVSVSGRICACKVTIEAISKTSRRWYNHAAANRPSFTPSLSLPPSLLPLPVCFRARVPRVLAWRGSARGSISGSWRGRRHH